MDKGWIRLYRKLLHSDMYKALNSKQRDVMFVCLMLANHSENQWEFGGKIYKCEAGQFITSLPKLAGLCANDVKVQSIRTALLKLERWGFLTNESTAQNRLITICKWGDYQQIKEDVNSQPNRRSTDDQQTTNRQLTANKNVKNGNNEKNDNKKNSKPELETRDGSTIKSFGVKADFFIKLFNETVGSAEKPRGFKMNKKLSESLSKRLDEGYSSKDFITAIVNCKKDGYHIETKLKHLTPEFILRVEKLEKYLNAESAPVNIGSPMTNSQKRKQGLIPELRY